MAPLLVQRPVSVRIPKPHHCRQGHMRRYRRSVPLIGSREPLEEVSGLLVRELELLTVIAEPVVGSLTTRSSSALTLMVGDKALPCSLRPGFDGTKRRMPRAGRGRCCGFRTVGSVCGSSRRGMLSARFSRRREQHRSVCSLQRRLTGPRMVPSAGLTRGAGFRSGA